MFKNVSNLMINQFDNGFRLVKHEDENNKHWILDELDVEVGDVYEVGPNGYFELVSRRDKRGVPMFTNRYSNKE